MKPIHAMFALLAIGAASSAHAGLPDALDGSWYNPAQSGHGLTLERIDHDSALLFWHVFDPGGKPLTLYVETKVEGDTMKGEVLAPSGMRFGLFEESELALPFWGKVELAFTDCTHATLKYDSPLAGYGQGEIPLTRLLPAEADCSLQAPAGLATLAGHGVEGTAFGEYGTIPSGFVFPEPHYSGRLDGFVTDDGGLALMGDSYNTYPSADDFVLVGAPLPAAAGSARLDVQVYANGWLNEALGTPGGIWPAGRRDRFTLELQTRQARARGAMLPREDVAPGQPDGYVHVTPGGAGEGTLSPGVYFFTSVMQGVETPRGFRLEVGEDLALCVRPTYDAGPVPACVYAGHAINGAKHFSFELWRGQNVGLPSFTGAGQARRCRPAQLFCTTFVRMVGDDGQTGLALHSTQFSP